MKDAMFRFAKHIIGSTDEAQDVVQDLMLKFWENRTQLAMISNLNAYLMKSVKNDCLNRLKHEEIKRKFSNENNLTEKTYHWEHNNLQEKILEFINELPEKQRWIIHLKDVEDYDIKEISEIVGIEQTAVRVNLMRARNKVKESIQKLLASENENIEKLKISSK